MNRTVITIWMLLATSPAFAKPAAETSSVDPLSAPRAERFALTFPFNGFSLASFSTGFGVKYWASEKSAWTATLTLSSTTSDNDYPAQPVPSYQASTSSAQITAGLAAGFESHLHVTGEISPYIGAGATVSYGSSKNSSTTNTGLKTENTSHTLTFGADGVVGIEYFITKNLSFSGQHTIGVSYSKTTVDAGVNYPNGTGWTIGIGTSSLIVALYL